MKNLQIIFGIIRKYCATSGISNEQCFAELERLPVNNSIFFPLFTYLRVLHGLGLIKISRFRKVITLTDKGKAANEGSVLGLRAYVLLFLHSARRIFTVTILFALFWPPFLAIQRQYNAQRVEEGSR